MSLQISSFNAPLILSSVAFFSSTAYGAVLGGLDNPNAANDATTTDEKTDQATTKKEENTTEKTATDATKEKTDATTATDATAEKTTDTTAEKTTDATTDATTEKTQATTDAKDTSTTQWWTPASAATSTATTDKTSQTKEAKESHVTYNQWGFTGSQSVWKATTLASGSSSGSHSSHSVNGNKTSNANRQVSSPLVEKSYGWKKTLLIGGLFGVTLGLHSL